MNDRDQMDAIIDVSKDAIIDGFAEFIKSINDRKYDDAALQAHSLAYTLNLISQGLAAEALTRRIEDRLDKPE